MERGTMNDKACERQGRVMMHNPESVWAMEKLLNNDTTETSNHARIFSQRVDVFLSAWSKKWDIIEPAPQKIPKFDVIRGF
jgi:hypothetical protein